MSADMSMSHRRLSLILAAAALAWAAAPAQAASAVVTTHEVRAELTAQALQGVAPGQTVWLGLEIQHQPGWHTYWKNPGDSGLPTSLQWQLPAEVSAGEIAWPTPKKLPVGPLLNYGYDGTLLLPVPLKIGPGFSGATLPVRLHAAWLVCKEVCIPEEGNFALDVPAQAATVGSAAFATAFAALPQTVAAAQASARIDGAHLVVSVAGLPAAWQGKPLDFLPETAGVIANAAVPEASWQGSTWNAKIAIDAQRSAGPAILPAVLSTPGQAAGVAVQVKVESPWPPIAEAAPLPPITVAAANPPAPLPPPIARSGGLALTLVLALAGGLLLNLMPCVFPVLSLKVLSFASHAHDRSKLIAGALAYLAGVVLSFLALAGLLLALRAGGEQLGWGFQLQQPAVVAALALLFTLIGLNLAGVFDFGTLLPSSWASARARHPLADSLLTGVLAVAVASPCTAPFMGASLGVAVTLPAAQALAVFAALGLGMALPMLLASIWPALADALPRPGPWMAHVRGLLAFPMFATVVWLVWVLGQQAGIDAAAALLATLVALAFVAWVLGSVFGRVARLGFSALALALFASALIWTVPLLHVGAAAATSTEAGWEPWSAARTAELTAQGRPVFVDFTAAWCVTCQVNKRTTLSRDEVRADFERHHVALLRADWTRRDPTIAAELARLGRSGVPVYALYRPGSAEPQVASEILSVGEIKDMLSSLP